MSRFYRFIKLWIISKQKDAELYHYDEPLWREYNELLSYLEHDAETDSYKYKGTPEEKLRFKSTVILSKVHRKYKKEKALEMLKWRDVL